MNPDRSLRSMDFMMNAFENTEMQMYGNISLIYLILYQLLLLLRTRSSVYMEVFHQVLTLWNKLNNSIEFKRFLMKVQCVISFGQILTIDAVGVSRQEVLATLLVKTSQSNLIIPIISSSSLELIS